MIGLKEREEERHIAPERTSCKGETGLLCHLPPGGQYHRIVKIFSATTVVIAAIALIGWVLKIPEIAGFGFSQFPMAPPYAIHFILLGSSLYLAASQSVSRMVRICGYSCLILVSLSSLLIILFQLYASPEHTIYRFPGIGYSASPLPLVIPASFILCCGAMLFIIHGSLRYLAAFSAAAGNFIMLIYIAVILGYLYMSPLFYGGESGSVSIGIALAFFFLSLALITASGPDHYPLRMLVGSGLTPLLMRAFTVLLFVNLLSDGLFYNLSRGLKIDAPILSASSAFFSLIIAFVVLAWVAVRLGEATDREQALRRDAEIELRKHYDNLEEIVQQRVAEIVRINRRLEEEIAEREHAEQILKNKEYLIRKMLDTSPNIIYIYNLADNRNTYVNHGIAAVLGYSPEEIGEMGQSLFEKTVESDDLARIIEHHRKLSKSESDEIRELEYRMKHRDGQLRWLLSRDIPFSRGDDGTVTEIMGTAADITERKKIEEQLARQAVECARSNAELEQFAYLISHDLQEPLQTVAGFSRLLRERYEGKLDRNFFEFIDYIASGASAMQTMIDGLLAYSRIGRVSQQTGKISLESVIQQVTVNLKLQIEESGAEITHESLPEVTASEIQMLQLFQNLIGNAIKFRREESPRIQVAVTPLENVWRFSVKDNGMGISPEDYDKIFKLFQRIGGRKGIPGSGIGLATCRKIVENLEGRIWVESEQGKGSAFYFTIPRQVV